MRQLAAKQRGEDGAYNDENRHYEQRCWQKHLRAISLSKFEFERMGGTMRRPDKDYYLREGEVFCKNIYGN